MARKLSAQARKLRVATAADAPIRTEPMTLKTASEKTERELLVTIRAKIAGEIDAGVPAHTLAPLSRQLLDIDKQIRSIDVRSRQDSESRGHVDLNLDDTFDASAI